MAVGAQRRVERIVLIVAAGFFALFNLLLLMGEANGASAALMLDGMYLFACGLLPYYEEDIAYQVPSNYLRIMVDCMDFDLAGYINHGDAYFLSALDEHTGHTFIS